MISIGTSIENFDGQINLCIGSAGIPLSAYSVLTLPPSYLLPSSLYFVYYYTRILSFFQ